MFVENRVLFLASWLLSFRNGMSMFQYFYIYSDLNQRIKSGQLTFMKLSVKF